MTYVAAMSEHILVEWLPLLRDKVKPSQLSFSYCNSSKYTRSDGLMNNIPDTIPWPKSIADSPLIWKDDHLQETVLQYAWYPTYNSKSRTTLHRKNTIKTVSARDIM